MSSSIITYNFTDNNPTKKTTPDDIDEKENQLKRLESAEYDGVLGSYKHPNSPPKNTQLNTCSVGYFFSIAN